MKLGEGCGGGKDSKRIGFGVGRVVLKSIYRDDICKKQFKIYFLYSFSPLLQVKPKNNFIMSLESIQYFNHYFILPIYFIIFPIASLK